MRFENKEKFTISQKEESKSEKANSWEYQVIGLVYGSSCEDEQHQYEMWCAPFEHPPQKTKAEN